MVILRNLIDKLESGSRPKGGALTDNGVPSLGAEHLSLSGRVDFSKKKYVSRDYFNSLKSGVLRNHDVLIVKDGATTGKVAIWMSEFEDACINEHVFRIEVNSLKVLAKYAFYFLRSPQGNSQVLNDFRGATVGGISRSFVNKVKLPLPKLEEQKQIVQTLDTADNLRKKRKEQLALLDDYLKSVFLDMFGDPLTNNKNIGQRKIGDLGEVVTGNTPSRQKKEYYGDFIEWIKSDNINTPEFILTKAEEFLSEVGAKVGRIVSKGSVLVTCIAGSPECIGNCAVADRKISFNQQINAFVPGNEMKTEFFFAQLHICKRLVQQASTESMKGMVSKSRFSEIKILAPPLEQQIDFVKIFNSVAKMREKMQVSLDEMDNHFNALMQKCFG